MNTHLDFWQNSTYWPRDTKDCIFLGRAVGMVGTIIYKSEWTGEEARFELLPEVLRASAEKRFRKVQDEIAESAEKGELLIAHRAKAGGYQLLMPKHWWNTERLKPRFDFCQINTKEPFGTISTGDDFDWIFVGRESLNNFLALCAFVYDDSAPFENSAIEPSQEEPAPVMTKMMPISSKEATDQLYIERVKSYKGKRPPTRAEDEAYLRGFNIGRSRARQLRELFAPASWQKAGPRSKQVRE
jgi:hypothetical protein